MKRITINIYQFEELSETIQQTVLENFRGLNIDYQWWVWVYEDARSMGISIGDFDIDYRKIFLNLEYDLPTICNLIKEVVGEGDRLYGIAETYLSKWDELVYEQMSTDRVAEDSADSLTKEFKNELSNYYLGVLTQEYKHLSSDKAIIETLEANNYWFFENGDCVSFSIATESLSDFWETAVDTFREHIDNPELYEQHKKEYLGI